MSAAEKSGAGRPKSEEKREAIVVAATSLFLSEGFERTAMDSVAKQAGVSKQTVYSHFKNKETLYKHVIETKVAQYQLEDVNTIKRPRLADSLHAFGRQFVALISDDEVVSMFRIVIAESRSIPTISQLFYQSGPAKTLLVLRQFLDEVMANEKTKPNTTRMAVDFINLLKGDWHLRSLMGAACNLDEESAEKHIAHCVRCFMKAYELEERV